jgi:hypothetical protein
MAAAISPAVRSLDLVIPFLQGFEKPMMFGLAMENANDIERLNPIFPHVFSTSREIGKFSDHDARRRAQPQRAGLRFCNHPNR